MSLKKKKESGNEKFQAWIGGEKQNRENKEPTTDSFHKFFTYSTQWTWINQELLAEVKRH